MSIIRQKHYVYEKGKVAGAVEGDTLTIIKTSINHLVRRYDGFGVNESTLKNGQKRGAVWLVLEYEPEGETFRLKIADYLQAAIRDDLGASEQLFMSRKNMRWYQNHKPAYRNEPLPIQTSMFG